MESQMRQEPGYWQAHIEAAKREGMSTIAYAKQHGLGVKSLYRWQRKLATTSAAVTDRTPPGKFVALCVAKTVKSSAFAEATVATVASGCTLQLGPGLRLEMATLPPPQWLAAMIRTTQGAS
jgi:hypothetical protein